MRILQINKHHYIKGGADRVYFNTSHLLEENQHEVISFSTSHAGNLDCKYSEFFVPFIENRGTNFTQNVLNSWEYIYNKSAFKNLNRLIDTYRPDVAHLHLFYGELSASVLKSLRGKNIPIVLTVHDYRLLCPANALLDANNCICEKCKNKSYYQCTIKKCLENNFFFSSILSVEAYFRKYFVDPLEYIDRFIFVSKFSKQKHVEFDSRFLGKSDHLYNFTDVEKESATSDKEGYFLFFGRLSKEKGLETLLNVAKDLKVNLKIAGTGPLEGEVSKCSEQYKHIQFVGYKSGDDLTELIRKSAFIIVPSEWYENNPMTIIEAYANGVPVIGARIGGIPEIVIENKTGFLFESRNEADLKDVILKAERLSSGEYLKMSANAIEFARQNFSSKNHYEKLMGIYSNVLQNV